MKTLPAVARAARGTWRPSPSTSSAPSSPPPVAAVASPARQAFPTARSRATSTSVGAVSPLTSPGVSGPSTSSSPASPTVAVVPPASPPSSSPTLAPPTDDLTLIVERWLGEAPLAPRTAERYAYSFSALVRHGVKRWSQVTRATVAEFLTARRASGLSAQTANRDLAALTSLASWLERRGETALALLHELRRLKVKTPAPPPPAFLTDEQERRLVEVAEGVHPTLRLFLLVLFATGMRAGEARTIHHEHFHLDGEHAFVEVWAPKTSRARTTPIPRERADELREHGVGKGTGPVFPSRPGGRGGKTSSPYVALPTLERWLWCARKVAGVPGATFIIARHTVATRLISANISPAKVSRWLGHGILVCLSRYAGFIPGGDRDVEAGARPRLTRREDEPEDDLAAIERASRVTS